MIQAGDYAQIGLGERKWIVIAIDANGICELRDIKSGIVVHVSVLALIPL